VIASQYQVEPAQDRGDVSCLIERLRSDGFAPAVVLETSPGNFQAWLHHGEILPKHLSTLAARMLASRFGGDLASADWRHFGRLAGFTNRKGKYQKTDGTFPYVRLHEATGAVYSKSVAFLAEVKTLFEASNPSLHIPLLRGVRACVVRISKRLRTSVQSLSTAATIRA
jgi:hypothetical protein